MCKLKHGKIAIIPNLANRLGKKKEKTKQQKQKNRKHTSGVQKHPLWTSKKQSNEKYHGIRSVAIKEHSPTNPFTMPNITKMH